MNMSPLSGFVYSTEGTPLQNVVVTSGTEVAVTGPDGGFALNSVNSINSNNFNRTVVKFSCSGYTEIVRAMPTKAGDVWEVTMVPTYSSLVVNDYQPASEDISVKVGETGMKVDLQANGLKFAETGEPVGTYDMVSAQVLYLDPDNKDFASMMPGGDLAAVRSQDAGGGQVQLVSYGMVKVDLAVNGKKVQPTDGKPAKLTFPVPEKFKDNTPAEIPLWSFNEQTGLWEEEGLATYDSAKDVYTGTVKHFSWVNLDYPELRATLKVNVKDEAGNVIPNQLVDIDGQRYCTTDKNGAIECYVPTNTEFYVTVRSRDYSNYSPEKKVENLKLTQAGSSKTIDIVLPTMVHISGNVINTGKGNNLSSLWIEYDGKSTKAVHTDAIGQFILNAPFDYKGNAKLVLLASDGSMQKFDIKLDGKDHAYTLSIKTDTSTGGIITYLPTGGEAKTIVVAPVYASDFAGVEIVDNKLSVSTGDISLTIDEYSEGKTSYNNANINVYSGRDYFMCKATNVTISKNEYNNYTFNISGDAQSQSWNYEKQDYDYVKIGTFSGSFGAPMFGKGKTIKPVTKKESFFPSFTPWIGTKYADVALQITECPIYGTGVLLWFFNNELNYDDYKALKAQAQQALGDPIASSGDSPEEQEYQDMCVSYFYKDGKFIMVSYCPWRDVDPEYIDDYTNMSLWCLRENHAARIQVHALEGLQASPDELIMIHGK
jgi:hypothetical protein